MNSHSSNLLFLGVNSVVENIPTPSSISFFWNIGSLLGACLFSQLLSGIFISFHYSSSLEEAFESVVSMEDVFLGWVTRLLHVNGASFFFILTYLHISRGLFYGSFFTKNSTWIVGVVILFLLMGTAFLGYVLPWGQISFWGATVITNLLSALPFGEELVFFIWGGFSVSGPTLTRFFSIHFILPFSLLAMTLAHITLLHLSGSSNPLGVLSDSDKIFFHPFFSWNDLLGFFFFFITLMAVIFTHPDVWMDKDNFSPANPIVTPVHIQPEWYFLFAYAILRSIPNKLGGVLALFLSIAFLIIIPFLSGGNYTCRFSNLNKVFFSTFCCCFLALTLLGALPAEGFFVLEGQLFTILYFLSLTGLAL